MTDKPKHPGGRPLKFQDVTALEAMIDSYFAGCNETGEPYTITGLAVWLDCDRETLTNYQERPEFFDTIKRAKLKCQAYLEKNALQNKLNPTISIFSLKNNYGWVDKTEQDITSQGERIVVPILGGETLNAIQSDDSNTQSPETT